MTSRRDFLSQSAAVGLLAASATQLASAAATDKAERRVGPLKLALVGAGEITPCYLDQAKDNERVHFVATCARTLESAKARAVEYGMGAWFDDYNKMYDMAKPHAVVIATPHGLHAEHSIAALDRGIHVLCEKPMATRLEDCHAMVETAQKTKSVLLCLPFDATAPS